MEFRLVLSGGIVQKGYVGYLIFCLKIDLRNTNLLRKNPINNNDQQHKNLAHSAGFNILEAWAIGSEGYILPVPPWASGLGKEYFQSLS